MTNNKRRHDKTQTFFKQRSLLVPTYAIRRSARFQQAIGNRWSSATPTTNLAPKKKKKKKRRRQNSVRYRNCSHSSLFSIRSLPAESFHKLGHYTKFQFEFKHQLIIFSFFSNKSSQAIDVSLSSSSLLLLLLSFSFSFFVFVFVVTMIGVSSRMESSRLFGVCFCHFEAKTACFERASESLQLVWGEISLLSSRLPCFRELNRACLFNSTLSRAESKASFEEESRDCCRTSNWKWKKNAKKRKKRKMVE